MSIQVKRLFTKKHPNPYHDIKWKKVDASIIDHESNKVIWSMKGVVVPVGWNQVSADIVASKYMRKKGVSQPLENYQLLDCAEFAPTKMVDHEWSVEQIVNRVVETIGDFGKRFNYFDEENGDIFVDELKYIIVHGGGLHNSPVEFNVGLYYKYGIFQEGENFAIDLDVLETINSQEADVEPLFDKEKNRLKRPQASACFIASVEDSLKSIFGLVMTEGMAFKGGSGIGEDLSPIRGKGESLNTGGVSSGLMSYLALFDRVAGTIKSGGTTRKAASNKILSVHHPEILAFIESKSLEEEKAKILIANGYSKEEAYKSILYQNANHNVAFTNEFMEAVRKDEEWPLFEVTSDKVVSRPKAREIWDKFIKSSWRSGDPNAFYIDNINDWHTCPKSGRIKAANPCIEFQFLNDSACNLASLNLPYFMNDDGTFRLEEFEQAVFLFILSQDILVDLASYPTKKIAENSHKFRPLGLGYLGIGYLLMVNGIPYDSEEGRNWAATLTSLMTATAYKTSAKIADQLCPFSGFEKNEEPMRKVIDKHYQHAVQLTEELPESAENSNYSTPYGAWNLNDLRLHQATVWKKLFSAKAFRNAQTTLLAPTGTISFWMGMQESTGVEPIFSPTVFKKMSDGGNLQMVSEALEIFIFKNYGIDQNHARQVVKNLILGKMTIEEATENEGLEDPKNALGFASASPLGNYVIPPKAHVLMVNSVGPFLSGGISKTVNVPKHTTTEEVSDIYQLAHTLGLKSLTVYRDNSKESQILYSGDSDRDKEVIKSQERCTCKSEIQDLRRQLKEMLEKEGRTYRPPKERNAKTFEFRVFDPTGSEKVYVHTGIIEDGDKTRLVEVFVDCFTDGSLPKVMFNQWSISISYGLQHGSPLDKYVKKGMNASFSPQGITDADDPRLKFSPSILATVLRYLDIRHLGGKYTGPLKHEAIEALSGSYTADVNNTNFSKDALSSGELCPNCHNMLRRVGTCPTCPVCNWSGGCG